MKSSFVTWQLRRLHSGLDAIEKQRGDTSSPEDHLAAKAGRTGRRDRTYRRVLLDRMLRALPKRLGFRDARAFARAFARANHLLSTPTRARRRLTPAEVDELERRVLRNERPSAIARAIGCAEQTVLNRASQLRKRLSAFHEQYASGI